MQRATCGSERRRHVGGVQVNLSFWGLSHKTFLNPLAVRCHRASQVGALSLSIAQYYSTYIVPMPSRIEYCSDHQRHV